MTKKREHLDVRDRLRTAAAIGLAAAVVAAALAGVWALTHRPVPAEEQVYLREVHVAIDVSRSMDPCRTPPGGLHLLIDAGGSMKPCTTPPNAGANFATAKQKAAEVVAATGPGDWVAVYTIGTGFSEERNVVLNDGLLSVPVSFRQRNRRPPHDEMAALRRTSEAIMAEKQWLPAIDRVQQDPPDGRSDYLSAFDYLARRLTAGRRRHLRRVEVVSFGDLEQIPMPAAGRPPRPDERHAGAFAGARIRLSYPYRAERNPKQATLGDLEAFWREYFEARGATEITIAPFGDGAAIAPPLAFE